LWRLPDVLPWKKEGWLSNGKLRGFNNGPFTRNGLRRERGKFGQFDISYLTGGQGAPLLVIHGGGDSGRAWLQNAVELSKYYRVYVPDLPGFGRSRSMDDNFELPEFVAFVEDFANNLHLGRFHLIGHSLGGGIALYYALIFPHKINRLVLVSSICLGREIALWARFMSCLALYRPFMKVAFSVLKAARWLGKLFYNPPHELMDPLFRIRMDIGQNVMTLKGQTTVLLNHLSELLVPTLLVWGARDPIVPVSHAYTAARLIPDCQLHVFKSCGHSVYKQRLHEFSRLMVNFLG
jgi:pimeloyl-ACP methyl ester carboxylesterase